ncbi:hypothetical protein Peur_013537 [Populus x canadensis]
MCSRKRCSTCGKTTWDGCGRHVPSVYRGIPEGQHCFCREWPGVDPNNPKGNVVFVFVEGNSSALKACMIDYTYCNILEFSLN